MSSLKGYLENKESGLQWAGIIPSHWKIEKVRRYFNLVKRPSLETDPIVLSLTQTGIRIRDLSTLEGQVAKTYEGYNIVERGNICLNPMDLESGAAAISNYAGVISNAYFTITPTNNNVINSRFYSEYFNLHYKIKIFYPYGKGVGRPEGSGGRWTLNRETFMNFPIIVPPREEQDQIVKFLDNRLAKIAKLIKVKKKQIALLKEQKQAIINHAVTKGLDPNAKMKPSGIEWLGDIPEGWEISRNKNVLTESKSIVGEKANEYTLLSLTLNGIIKRDIESGKGKFPKEFDTYKIVEKGDIVFCLFDIEETPRTVGLSEVHGMITGAYDVFKISGIHSKYLYYYYLSIDDKKALQPLYTGLRKVINVPVFLSAKLIIPPDDEQQGIVAYIEKKSKAIDKAILKMEKEISLITEYRTRLISDVVTGKVDVRSMVVEETPEETEDYNDIEDTEDDLNENINQNESEG